MNIDRDNSIPRPKEAVPPNLDGAPDIHANSVSFIDLVRDVSEIPPSIRVDAITDLAVEYGERRGALCALGTSTEAALARLDNEFFSSLENCSTTLSGDPDFIAKLKDISIRSQDDARLDSMEEIVRKKGLAIGLLFGREVDESKLQAAKDDLANYLKSQGDLLCKYPSLRGALDTVIQESEADGIGTRLKYEKESVSLFWAMSLRKRNYGEVCRVLENCDARERQLLKDVFVERYKYPINEALKKKFKGVKLSHALALLEGNDIAAISSGICLGLMKGIGTFGENKRFMALRGLFERVQKSDWKAIEKDFAKNYAHHFDADTLDDALKLRLKSLSFKCLMAIKTGEEFGRDAILIRKCILGDGVGREVINHTLESYKNGDLSNFKKFFHERFGTELYEYLRRYMVTGCQKDRALAYLIGDQERFLASRVKCAFEKLSGETMGNLFLDQTKAERERIVRAFESVYKKDFWHELKNVLSWLRKREFKLIQSLVIYGRLSPSQMLKLFIEGPGTNEDGIVAVLKHKTREEVREISTDYSKNFHYKRGIIGNLIFRHKTGEPMKLLRDLKGDLSGDSRFDIFMLYRGTPKTPRAHHADMVRRYDHEESGRLFKFLLGWTDRFFVDCRILKRDVHKADKFYKERINGKQPTRDDLLKFETLARIAKVGIASFRVTKKTVAADMANIATPILGLSVALGVSSVKFAKFAGFSPNVHLIVTAAVIIGVTLGVRSLVHGQILGKAYGLEQRFTHGLFSVFDGLGFGARKFVSGIWGLGVRVGAKTGAKQLVTATEFLGQGKTTAKLLSINDLERLDGDYVDEERPALDELVPFDTRDSSVCQLCDRGLEAGWDRIEKLLGNSGKERGEKGDAHL